MPKYVLPLQDLERNIMARQIKETPVLKGKEAEQFIYNAEHPTPVSKEEAQNAMQTYELFKSIADFTF